MCEILLFLESVESEILRQFLFSHLQSEGATEASRKSQEVINMKPSRDEEDY